MILPSVTAKLGAMRKPQRFLISPMSTGEILVQSAKSIGKFDPATGVGILNTKGSYFPHLHPVMGAKPFTYPAEFVAEAVKVCPEPGGSRTIGGVTIVNTVEVI